MKNNITLIGMPGSGKSTVGVVLAKRLGRRFVDSDLVIKERKCLSESGKQHHCHRRKRLLRAGGHAASAGYQHRGIFEASL